LKKKRFLASPPFPRNFVKNFFRLRENVSRFFCLALIFDSYPGNSPFENKKEPFVKGS